MRGSDGQERRAALRWIGIILGLLGGNALAVGILLAKAGRADASKVYPDYYQRAAAWDQTMAQAQRVAGLGWRVEVTIHGDGRAQASVVDSQQRPIAGATVTVRGFQRGHAERPFAGSLVAGDGGVYVGEVGPVPPPGLADAVISVDAPGLAAPFSSEMVIDIGASAGVQ